MKQYIDKANVVAKIDDWQGKIIKGIATIPLRGRERADAALEYEILGKVIEFLSTLEVKEVDFSTEVYKYIDEHFNVYDDGNQTLQTKDKKSLIGMVDVENIAKHFYELGLKAQKGERV